MSSTTLLPNGIFIYAQSLGNSGETEYWLDGARLASDTPQAAALRKAIDLIFGAGRIVYSGAGCEFWIEKNGLAAIKAYPKELDVGGRESPVIVVFKRCSGNRKHISAQALGVALSPSRTFHADTVFDIDKIFKWISLPGWLILVLVFIRRCRKVFGK